jgi:hypothetical protein
MVFGVVALLNDVGKDAFFLNRKYKTLPRHLPTDLELGVFINISSQLS